MKKIHIWIGTFSSENDFESYLNQDAYLKEWAKYSNESMDIDNNDNEPNPSLRCQFCKETELDTYDEDFIIFKYSKNAENILQLLSIVPVSEKKLNNAIEKHNFSSANSVIYYTDDELTELNASKSTKMHYLGLFEEENVINNYSGLRHHLWIGETKKNREEFMEYFNQAEYLKQLNKFQNKEIKSKPSKDIRCQFCKDLEIDFYDPSFLTIYFSHSVENAEEIINKNIKNSNLKKPMASRAKIKTERANAMFSYIDNGSQDSKRNKIFVIFLKEFEKKHPLPKGALRERNTYNDLKYVGVFKWE